MEEKRDVTAKTRRPIRSWRRDEMPREKFLDLGAASLGNAELLAIILRSGTREKNAIELAREILEAADGSIGNLKRFAAEDFLAIKGVGTGKALSIMAAFEMARRVEMERVPQEHIYSSQEAAQCVAPLLRDLDHEECWTIFLNHAQRVISKERITAGGLTATVIDSKIIVKKAISKLASGIILVHNHPSGNHLPSSEDCKQTARLKIAANSCDIMLVDHIIIAGERYYSFADGGDL